jgi:hypothetical protein
MQAKHTRQDGKPIPTTQELLLAQLKADDPEIEQHTRGRRPSHANLNRVRDRLHQLKMPTDPVKVRAMAIGLVDYARGVTKSIPGLLM